MLFRRTLPIANLAACLLFVLLREPDSWYLAELDRARQEGSVFMDDGVWGTLACRTLNNWGPVHGGEAIGVAALEVLNLPSLFLTGIAGLFGDVFGGARITSACRWSWLLAGVFIVLASTQWWFVGRALDRRRGRINIRPIWLAYAAAPFGALPVGIGFQVWYSITEDVPARGTALLTGVLVLAYFFGLWLLPVWWIFKKAGWSSWRYYVPTGTCAGVLIALSMGGSTPDWESYLLFGLSGTLCAIVFSVVLACSDRTSA
jgi:hypothetical protein